MFNARQLFSRRLTSYLQQLNRYLRYIFNGHMAIALVFFIAAGAVYYQQWLQTLPENFPTAWVIGVAFGLIATYTPIRTLLQKPDMAFLLPAEHKMTGYFHRALIFSLLHHAFPVLFLMAAVSPLYFHTYPERSASIFVLTCLVVWVFKIWNLIITWWLMHHQHLQGKRLLFLGRMILTMVVIISLILNAFLLTGILTVIFVAIYFYCYFTFRVQAGYAWEELIQLDDRYMQSFYRVANMFTDVPNYTKPMKKRGWLVSFVHRLPFAQKYTYDFLFRIAFIRSGDYLGMYMRLLILGSLLIYFVPMFWLKVIFGFLFLYMSMFQLMTLSKHFRTNILPDLYPIEHHFQTQAVQKWIYQLSFVQAIVFSVIFLIVPSYLGSSVMLVGGFLFIFIFMNGYMKKKIT